jgi:hypothetical protein
MEFSSSEISLAAVIFNEELALACRENRIHPHSASVKISIIASLKMHCSRLRDRWKVNAAILPTALGRLMVARCGSGLNFKLCTLSTTSRLPRCPYRI